MPFPTEYKHILRPSVDYLSATGKLLLDTEDMAKFLNVPRVVVHRLIGTDRIPLPMKLGFGKCCRWNVFELLEWIEAGCPRRSRWIEMRGRSGWYPLWRWSRW